MVLLVCGYNRGTLLMQSVINVGSLLDPLDLSQLVLGFLVALALGGIYCFAAAPTVVTFPEADAGPLAGDVLGGLALA